MLSCCSRRCLLVSSVLTALLVGALVAVLVVQPWANHNQTRYRRAAVAANGYECASVGRAILERQGSAVDAAIATLFCEGISCAQCMGLGGGFLATIYDAQTRRVRVINARERAPAATTEGMFANASSTVGGLAIAVPGELRGYGALHREYGRLPWSELVQPTAELCRQGHRVNEYMGRVLKSYSTRIHNEPTMRELYVNPATGEVWNEGDYIREPTLARTLDIIAEEGPEAIHNGSLTGALVRDIQNLGGIITEADLNNYRVEWQEPIEVPLSEEHTLYSVPLPGSGSVLAFILNMLNGWVGVNSDVARGSNLYWHRVVETFKYAYAKRTGLGDPSRSNLTYQIRDLEHNLSNIAWARSFRNLVDDKRTFSDWRHYGAIFEGADDHGTAHIVVIAPDGSVVSATSTINYIWGSQRRSTSLGIMLNNEMDDFSIPSRDSSYGMPPSPANMLAPGLQPLSSMVPSVVLSRNGTADLVIGAAGGTKITTQVALVAMHSILEGDELSDIIPRPRLHHQLMPMEVEYESDFKHSVIESLRARGHATTERGPTAGFAAMVGAAREHGFIVPQTDRRRVGSVDGF
ncbi:glutathione hydrolase 1 proenzyme-like isoform X1 [Danaus plexippus]|uniref:Gamma-glutamyl transpeptidase n=2 Tax=Danaus plexippus TaxID=13037 RepID=A0A212EI86_DANPL|nr:glutathione hydrolase 1 proenzyme-like isoform X1 [Danaus plexippus]OWR41202.1 gamma-glutamyl transpeptidase [Danaus plexippus plexippus]